MFSALFFFHQCNFGSASTSCHITVVIKREKKLQKLIAFLSLFPFRCLKKKKKRK